MSDEDRVAVPRKRLSASHRISGDGADWVALYDARVFKEVKEVIHAIEREAAKNTTLLAGKPRVTITIQVEQEGYAFPAHAKDIYEAEHVGRALGMEVPAHCDTLVFARAQKWRDIRKQD